MEEFLSPVADEVLEFDFPKESIGGSILKHSLELGIPDLTSVSIVFFDVVNSNAESRLQSNTIRKEFYSLYKGNWSFEFADVGSIQSGADYSDTQFAVENVVTDLLKKNIVPVVLGAELSNTFACFKAYHFEDQPVNLSVISSRFGLGSVDVEINQNNYLSKIILQEESNLFSYSNLGYQTYLNAQKEIDLIESLNFEAYRLGDFEDVSKAEPILRDADMLVVDFEALKASEAPGVAYANPNGFTGVQACKMARYAGMSDRLSCLCLFNYHLKYDVNSTSAIMIAQIVWYFIEGFHLRVKDYPFGSKDDYLKYMVPVDEHVVVFYQSHRSLRWWVQVDYVIENNTKRSVLLPCSYQDYEKTTEGKLPTRWFKHQKKMMS